MLIEIICLPIILVIAYYGIPILGHLLINSVVWMLNVYCNILMYCFFFIRNRVYNVIWAIEWIGTIAVLIAETTWNICLKIINYSKKG